MTGPVEAGMATTWNQAYHEQLRALLDHLNANAALSSHDRETLLSAHVKNVEALLRELRRCVSSSEDGTSRSRERQDGTFISEDG